MRSVADVALTTEAPEFRSVESETCDRYGPPPQDPVEALNWMNQRHAVVREAGKTVVLTETDDEVLKRRFFVRSTFADIKNFYANRNVLSADEKGTTCENLAKFWLTHPDRRQFAGVTFSPGHDTPGRLNLWQGFGVRASSGNWSLMQAHIRRVICSDDPDASRWVMAWLAAAVQRPDEPAEVALVLRGRRGTGKGIFVRSFGRLFSPHFVHVSSPRHLLGNFNAHLQDAIVVFADEAFLAGDAQGESTLKMIITESQIPIERKHHDVVMGKNVIHLVIASNGSWVVPAGHDERRYCVLDIADAYAQDHNYFAALLEQLGNGGYEAMLYDLQRYDYSTVNLRQPPKTLALLDQKLQSMEPRLRWWFDKLMQGRLLPGHQAWETEVTRDDLHEDYCRTLQILGTRAGRSTSTELGLRLRELLPKGSPQELQRTIDGERKRLYGLPGLSICRAAFCGFMKHEFSWPQPLEAGDQPDVARL